MTREEFAQALCAKMGWSPSQNLIDALVAWQSAENSSALNNPLDTERVENPDSNYNSAGVKDYPTLTEGLQAVQDTLQNGLYPSLLLTIARQEQAAAIAAAIDASPWGTQNVVGVLAEVQADRTRYYTAQVNVSDGITPVAEPVTEPVEPVVAPVEKPEPAPVVQGFTFPDVSIAMEATESPEAKAIQAMLRDVWGLMIAVDGFYGPVTEGAVKSFQKSHNLSVDGVVGQVTYPALLGL